MPSWAKPDTACSRTPFGLCSFRRCSPEVCRRPAQTPPALSWRDPGRRDRPTHVFCPSTSRISRSRKNRLTAIQKSSRTMTMHCTRPPSHCRRACTSSVFCFFLLGVQPLLELVEDDQHLLAHGNALPPAQCRQRFFQTPGCRARPDSVSAGRSAGGFRFPRRWLRRRRRSRRRTDGATGPPSPATICRSRDGP